VDDVILRFNGSSIENDQHLISLVKLSDIGRKVELQVLRNGQLMTLQALIGRLEDFTDAMKTAAESTR
jgi:S1-C subfamily serine protease